MFLRIVKIQTAHFLHRSAARIATRTGTIIANNHKWQ
jgi:hypothetical protein